MRPPRRCHNLTLVFAVGAALAIGACTDAAPPPARLGSSAATIQGGNSDTTSTFAVAVVDAQGSTCSGTLIAPNLVLTARHCVAPDDGGAVVDCAIDRFLPPVAASSLRVSLDAASVTFAGAAFQITRVIVSTDTLFCGNDLALLVLDQLVPAAVANPVTPAIEPKLTDRVTYGTELTAIGYGTTSPGANDEGTRRKRTTIAIACVPGDATACNPADFDMTTTELAAGNGLCEGDSGSGAYLPASLAAGKPIVMGVLSRAGETATTCTEAVYGRTDTASALLVSAALEAASAGGYAAPAWADPTGSTKPDSGAPDGGTPSTEGPTRGDAGAPAGSDADAPDPVSTGCSAARASPRSGTSRGGLAAGGMVAWAMLATSRRRRRVTQSAMRR